MNYFFLNDGFASGSENMECDLRIAERAEPDSFFLRFYRWKPFCISLGAHQSFDDVDNAAAKDDGIDTVKRPTGGRAILHAEELTYAVIMPIVPPDSPMTLYRKINDALQLGLIHYDPRLSETELEAQNPKFRDVYATPQGTLCFASTAKNELRFKGKKIIGSAQRKIGSIILQHGSVLCGTAHRAVTKYLQLPIEEKNKASELLIEKTTEIESVCGEPVDYDRLRDSLLAGFSRFFDADFQHRSSKDF